MQASRFLPFLCCAVIASSPAPAQNVESYTLDGMEVTLRLHDFLTQEDIAMLRLVGQRRDALELFVPQQEGHAAMALAPQDGLLREGLMSESAVAIGDMPSLDAARTAAKERCNAARSAGPECVIALEIKPE